MTRARLTLALLLIATESTRAVQGHGAEAQKAGTPIDPAAQLDGSDSQE